MKSERTENRKTTKQCLFSVFLASWAEQMLDKTTCKGTRHLCSETLQNFLTRLNNQIFNKVFNFKVHCVYTSVQVCTKTHKTSYFVPANCPLGTAPRCGASVWGSCKNIWTHLTKIFGHLGNIWKLQQLIWRYCSHFSAGDSTTIYYLLRFLHSRSSGKLIKYKLLLTTYL